MRIRLLSVLALPFCPNINDGFTGEAPDLGALEFGQPTPHCGPRPRKWWGRGIRYSLFGIRKRLAASAVAGIVVTGFPTCRGLRLRGPGQAGEPVSTA